MLICPIDAPISKTVAQPPSFATRASSQYFYDASLIAPEEIHIPVHPVVEMTPVLEVAIL
jgi:hypothetical protein